MTRRRRIGAARWAARVAAAAALLPVVLLAAAAPGGAQRGRAGRLGQTPPVLSWIPVGPIHVGYRSGTTSCPWTAAE